MSSLKSGRRLVAVVVLATLLPLLLSGVYPLDIIGKARGESQPLSSGVAWTNEPIDHFFGQVQFKFIGIVPGNYTEPTSSDISTMRGVFSQIESGIANDDSNSILAASILAQKEDYQLIAINDSARGHRFFVLVEGQGVNRGWGSYFFAAERPHGTTSVIIEAPHPVTDFNSQNIAFNIFTGSYPLVHEFLVSGVFRTLGPGGQTDMAHRTLSIFESATEVSVTPGAVVIQIHSFDANRHPGYPLVVLSTGDGGTNGALESIASNLRSSGLSVGVFDGFHYEVLGGTDNAQGRYVRSQWAGFVHAEISSTAVFNSTLISGFQSSVVQSVSQGFRFPGYQVDPRIPLIAAVVLGILLVGRFRLPRPRPGR